jgi:EmrB/QacA subfamily drug resistance transporter
VIQVTTTATETQEKATREVRKPLVLVALLLAAFAINLDTTIVNVALPTLVKDLHASTSQLEWIVDAYSLAFAALVLAAGNFSDRLGRKGVLLAGLGVFTAATVAGGLGSNSAQLIAARAVMGVGAALIFPATLSLLTNVFTGRGERARAIGLWGATTGIGIAVGPIVGGWLLEEFSWQSVFFALAPLALLGGVLVAVNVPTSRDPDTPRADRLGLALSTLAMGSAIYAIIEAPNRGWTSTATIVGFAIAAVMLIAFVAWEHHVEEPMLDVKLFKDLRFSAASGAVTITFFSMMGFIFLVTMYFQFLKGYSPLGTGLRLLPVAGTVAITSVVGTKLAVRGGTKLVVATGLVSLAAGLAWTSFATASTSYLVIAAREVLLGAGMGLTSAPATESIMGAVPAAKAGIGSAISDATRVLGATVGVAVIGSIYASVYGNNLTSGFAHHVPAGLADQAHSSVGAAFGAAAQLSATGHGGLATVVHNVASSAFFDGFSIASLVAAGVALAGAAMALWLLPARPAAAPKEREGLELEPMPGELAVAGAAVAS